MRKRLWFGIIGALALARPAAAMEFSSLRLDDGLVAIGAFGRIAAGDSDRLMSVLVGLPSKE